MYAFLYPGQGSQYSGMGHDLFTTFSSAKEVFQEVDDTLNQNLSDLMFSGDENDLKQTENTQPALMAVSIATQRVLEKDFGVPVTHASYIAGHSLGEYSALCATGVFSLPSTARLLKIRGQAMQRAVPAGQGGMVALIGATIAQAEDIAKKAQDIALSPHNICEVANDNAPGQIVISGHLEAVNAAIDLAKDAEIKRAVLLPVSAPFHSSLMAPAAKEMKAALEAETLYNMPSTTVISNITASPLDQENQIHDRLIQQMTGRVRWVESMDYMAQHGVTTYVEVGAGKVLSGLMKRINKGATALSLETPQDIEAFAQTL